MGGVHGGEVGKAGGGVGRRPAQDVAQVRGVGVDGVPGDQELPDTHTEESESDEREGAAGSVARLGLISRPIW